MLPLLLAAQLLSITMPAGGPLPPAEAAATVARARTGRSERSTGSQISGL
jgi:hypothetical protein